jgi:NAD(P)-dependent dehydrogenase (short-subunit alcohol dehydrogenase family)
MNTRLKEKIAVVTGGAVGMGHAVARRFSREGARVVIADVDAAHGETTAEEIRREGGDAMFVRTDVSKSADVDLMLATTVKGYGGLDILYNNAAVHCTGRMLARMNSRRRSGTGPTRSIFAGLAMFEVCDPNDAETRRRIDHPRCLADRADWMCTELHCVQLEQRWCDRTDEGHGSRLCS